MLSIQTEDKGARIMLSGLTQAVNNMTPFWESAGAFMLRSIANTFRMGGNPKWPESRRAQAESGKTMLLSNRLRNSIAYSASASELVVGTNTRYARLQNEGGIVKPKKAKALAIPLHKEARRAAENVTSIKDIEGLWMLVRAGKAPLLCKTKGERTSKKTGAVSLKSKVSIEPWFVLLKSVKVPARPFLRVTSDDMTRLERMAKKYFDNAAKGGKNV